MVLVQVEKLMIHTMAYLVDTMKRSFSFSPVEHQLREELKRVSLVTHTRTHTHTHTYIYIYMYIYMCVCVCARAHMCTHT